MLCNQWLRLNAGLRRVDAGLEITWSRTGTGFMPGLPGLPGWKRVTGARERFLVKNNFGRIICLQPGKPGKHGITLVLNRFQLLPCWFWTRQFFLQPGSQPGIFRCQPGICSLFIHITPVIGQLLTVHFLYTCRVDCQVAGLNCQVEIKPGRLFLTPFRVY